jgi:hypothetical protein
MNFVRLLPQAGDLTAPLPSAIPLRAQGRVQLFKVMDPLENSRVTVLIPR